MAAIADAASRSLPRSTRAAVQPNFCKPTFPPLRKCGDRPTRCSFTTRHLNLLINNAGIGSGGPHGTRLTSADGHESRFAVNYLAGFLLPDLLLPLLKKSAPARIVNVSSLGQQALDFTDVMLTREYSGIRAYRQSKLAQILFTIDLAVELEGSGITVNALHPATFMNTKMVRDFGTPRSTVEEGALAILKLAN